MAYFQRITKIAMFGNGAILIIELDFSLDVDEGFSGFVGHEFLDFARWRLNEQFKSHFFMTVKVID